MNLLERISSPSDLRMLSKEQKIQLAQESREFLIDSVSKTGGHLGPSLGVVELTIALHSIYRTPTDKIVWDVGHQAYVHKLLTGRRDKFHTLRQFGGISGFPHITESEHDAMTVGHASTSISSALGLAQGRDIIKGEGDVVAVIGDGALTGGLAFEALNNLGASKTNMTVILNDNEMSIAPNVGGLSKYLTKIMTDKKFKYLKDNVWNILDQIPKKLGKGIQSAVHNIDDAVKKVVTPGKFFEDMGIRYIGPVDGHNFDELDAVLKYAKNDNKRPLIIHVLTQKGKGYNPAIDNATKFHGIGSFEKETGEVIASSGSNPSWSAVYGTAMSEIVAKDKSVVAVTAAMPDGTGLGKFAKEYPDNIIDVGIAEGHAVTYSAGLALSGCKPVVTLYSSFLQRAYDHIIHDVALENLNVVFCIDRAGIVGNDGPTHHGCFDLSFLRTIPNATILAPATAQDLRDMLYSAIYEINGPVFIRYPRGSSFQEIDKGFNKKSEFIPFELCKEGEVLVASVGNFFETASKVVTLLSANDINASLLDVKTIKPLNKKIWADIFSRYKEIITLEHNTVVGGTGSALMELANELVEEKLISEAPRFLLIGYPDKFIEQGDTDELLEHLGLTFENIADRISNFVETK